MLETLPSNGRTNGWKDCDRAIIFFSFFLSLFEYGCPFSHSRPARQHDAFFIFLALKYKNILECVLSITPNKHLKILSIGILSSCMHELNYVDGALYLVKFI